MEVTIMNIKKTLLNATLVLVTAGTLAACGQDSDDNQVEDAMSSAGDTVEQTIDDAGDALNNAGDAMGDTMTDAGNAIEDTCEEAKEGVDAEDTDC
jgi:predicted small secreted protein